MSERDIAQHSRERALFAAALRYDGLTLREIGMWLGGVTIETARQAVLKGERILATRYVALNECARRIQHSVGPT